jgi:hypothetical protein
VSTGVNTERLTPNTEGETMVPPRPPTTDALGGEYARHHVDPRLHAAWLPEQDKASQHELRDGLRSLGDVWHHQGRKPGDGLTVTPTSDGAVIHSAGQPVPAVIPVRCTPATRGRTLHIAAGVDLTEVGAFVDTLPVDLRPANYTVAPGVTFDCQP